MPFVHIRITDDGVNGEQKNEVIAQVTATLVSVLGKHRSSCHVVIEEVPLENWGFDGESVRARRERHVDG